MSAADPSAAVCAYLLAQAAVDAAVSGRVFRPELPQDELPSMPRACIVVRHAGGYAMFGRTTLPLGDPRLDLLCYGETWLESANIADEVTLALKALRQSVWNGTRLYWARIEVGPMPVEDPKTDWPATLISSQVPHTTTQLVA